MGTKMMTTRLIIACVVAAIVCVATFDAKCNTAVCEKFYQGVYDSIEANEWKNAEKVENRIDKWCKKNTMRPFDKMCYYIDGVKRKIGKELMQEFGVDCPNCLEKSDMIKRIKDTILTKKE